MAPTSPVVAGWELGLRLRERRVELGLDVKAITDLLGFSRNYWSAVENDRKILAEDKLAVLLDAFEFDDDERKELMNLRETAKERGWWARYSALFSDDMLRFFGFEHGAEGIRNYESMLIPGLLQTADYARAVIGADLAVSQVDVDQRVEVRLRRQERLGGDDPVKLTAVVSQAALMQQVGGPEVQRIQLAHLAEMIESRPDTIAVHVVPFTSPPGGLLWSSTLYLLDFASPRLPTIASHETVSQTGVVVDDESEVRHMSMAFAEAMTCALPPKESLDLIQRSGNEIP
jgi:transcriptional regulator with XRE-family HTH domain